MPTATEAMESLGYVPAAAEEKGVEVDGNTLQHVALCQKWQVPISKVSEFKNDWNLRWRNFTVHHLRNAQKKVTQQWEIVVSADGKAAELPVKQIVEAAVHQYMATGAPLPDLADLKVSFDGSQLANNHRQNFNIATISFASFGSVADAMSPANAHIVWAASCKETEEQYREYMKSLAPQLEELLDQHELVVDNHKLGVRVRVVLDMKSLCMFLGLECVYNVNSVCGCPFCHVLRADFHCQRNSPLRKTEHVMDQTGVVDEASDTQDDSNFGFSGLGPLLQLARGYFIMDIFLPDILHIILNVPRKIRDSTMQYVSNSENDVHIQEELIAFFAKCGVYVPEFVKVGDKVEKAFGPRVKHAVWRRDHYLRLIANWEEFVNIVARCDQWKTTKGKQELTTLISIWKRQQELFVVMLSDKDSEEDQQELPWGRTEKEFNAKASEWGSWITKLFGEAGWTTYIHIVVKHVGRVLEICSSLPRYGNYDIEGMHLLVKRTKRSSLGQRGFAKAALREDRIRKSALVQMSGRPGKRARQQKAKRENKPVKDNRGRKLNGATIPLHKLKSTPRRRQ